MTYSADEAVPWRSLRQCFPRPDPALVSWLTDSGSLTRRLKACSGGSFRVEVTEERWVQRHAQSLVHCFEPYILRQRMWSRKVVLWGHGQPLVAAHSLVPVSSLHSALRQLRHLSERPLGEYLFSQPGLRRGEIELARIGNVWGRRSVFHVGNKPLLVAEFFLSGLFSDHSGSASAHYRARQAGKRI